MNSSPDTGAGPDRPYLEFELEGRPERWLFNLKPRAISLTVDTSQVFTFDLEGRTYAAFVDGRNYRRGLDGRVLEKYSEEEQGKTLRQRRFLDEEEQERFLRRIRDRLQELAGGRLLFDGEPPEDAVEGFRAWLERLLRWDAAALEADSRRFREIYRTVSILPPDQYMALVVQTTEGCPWNRCTFCELYRDRPYRVKSRQELQAHLESIREFLGEGVRLRRSIFLGDANMLTVSREALLATFAQVREAFRGSPGPADRFYGFSDVFGTRRHSVEDLEELHREGLKRLYLGLETGSDGLLQLLNKPGSAAEAIASVRKIHAAGIDVGVIVLLGLGGHTRAGEHEEETVETLNGMELRSGDMVYFSPLVEHAHGEYARQARDQGFEAMDVPAKREQRRRMEAGLRFAAGKAFTSIYDIRDFIY